ncbi:putative polygalacturonase [Lupinus albus]|uniref:Putative polygalacturonase n=1 Tax=Lupinus albus TaxID=3870 RepID=A0A6A4NFE4_LUPAL|nr:putative polygalacturonase [Lupinus albus]
MQILGNLLAPVRDKWGSCSRRWLYFTGVNGMIVDGSGVINGQGEDWWGKALLFEKCDGLQLSGLTHINGPGFHIHVVHSKNVTISNVTITAPEHSRNTDGIDTTNVEGIIIRDSIIGTGDDCIAIKGGTKFLNISNVQCGPGHGISVGSLGNNGQEEYASDIHVRNCTITGATGGVKIKTWAGGRGTVERVTFEHITVSQTNYPVYIDQHYFHSKEQPQAIKVSDITFSDIHGTCTTEKAIVLDCANIGCTNIILNQIGITSIDPKKPASTICNNVQGKATNISPSNSSCFKK